MISHYRNSGALHLIDAMARNAQEPAMKAVPKRRWRFQRRQQVVQIRCMQILQIVTQAYRTALHVEQSILKAKIGVAHKRIL